MERLVTSHCGLYSKTTLMILLLTINKQKMNFTTNIKKQNDVFILKNFCLKIQYIYFILKCILLNSNF